MSPDMHSVLHIVCAEYIDVGIVSIVMITSPVADNVGEKEEGPRAIPPF